MSVMKICVYLGEYGSAHYLCLYHNIPIIVHNFAVVGAQLKGPEECVDELKHFNAIAKYVN